MNAPNKRNVPSMASLPRPLFNRHESLAPGSWTEEHSHPWCQLSYASSGVLGVRTAAGDYVAPPRFAVWIPPDLPHQVVNRRRTEMRSLYVTPAAAAALPAECCVLEMSPLVRELIRRIGELPVEYDEAGPAGRLVAVLLDELAGLPRAGFGLPLPKDRRLGVICAALQEQPDDTRSLAQWAVEAGASERTLARLFVKETGLGFGEWRQRLRLLLSLDALEAGDSVTDVALAHGYESTSAFIAAFRGMFGVTPGELRGRAAL
ncbi:helix-turn-helix transcriptional regulator [Zoogloea sp.]|uniref:AraC family transcriptional regulator n=1 Tax=Zoogloea sp. TaxID=49181 RepID=UPI0035AEBA62